MSRLRAIRAALRLSTRRLRRRLGLTIGVVVAMASLVAVWVGVPLYAESASSRLLSQQVGDADADTLPFGYLFSFNRLSSGTQQWPVIDSLGSFLDGGDAAFGSSVMTQRRITETVQFDLYLDGDAEAGSDTRRLERIPFTAVNTFDDVGFQLTSGRQPEPAAPGDLTAEVLVSEGLSSSLGVSVGQELVVVNPRVGPESDAWSRRVRVAGTWESPSGSRSAESRFFRTGTVRNSLLVPEETIEQFVAPLDGASVTSAQWLVLLDPSRVTTGNVDALLARSDQLNREVDGVLPGARMVISPESSLENYQTDVLRLDEGLRTFSIPTLVMLLFVAVLVLAMSWRTRTREADMLRSRGIPLLPVVVAGVAEAVLMTAVAIAVGAVGAGGVALLMGRTETFLRVGSGVGLSLAANDRALRSLATVAILLLVMQLAPYVTLRGWTRRARREVRNARSEVPWWQRGRSDLVAAAVIGAFAWFVLRSRTISGNLLDDPVVILLPAAVAVAVGLVVLRLAPMIASGVAWLLARTDSTAALLAFRKASRASSASAAPLLLLVLTGALSIYTASLARTIDLQLVDRAHHVIGGESRIAESTPGASSSSFVVPSDPGPAVDPSGFERVWGVDSSSRVALLAGRAELRGGGDEIPIEVHAVDPGTFRTAAFWRSDYATLPLRELMDRLDSNRDAVLLRRSEMVRANVSVGDIVSVRATDGELGIDLAMVVVGHFDQFPAWQPSQPLSPAVISLPDLEQRVGEPLASAIIVSPSTTGRDDGQTRADLARLGVESADVETAAELIERAQQQPDRQGVFGLLTVSFLLSSALTVAGFVFFAVAGTRRHLTELGILRAAGLPQRSLLLYVAFDLLFVAAVGIGAAIVTGVTMSRVLLPRLVAAEVGSAPALLPEIDWLATGAITAALLVVFVVATMALLTVLRRIQLFEAVKIGVE